MSPSDDMTTILEELAAGRIDAGEAARRIDELSARDAAAAAAGPPGSRTDEANRTEASAAADAAAGDTEAGDTQAGGTETGDTETGDTETGDTETGDTEPADVEEKIAAASGGNDPDAWAASTDRPQQATHTRETIRTAPGESASKSATGTSAAGKAKPPRPRTPVTGGVEKLSVRAVGRRVRIVGEPSVATVSADGPHVLRRNGAVLEISSDGEFGASIDGFQLLKATRSLDDFRSLGLGKELLLRVNPSLLVDVEVTAGSLNTEGVPRLGKVRVTAGGAKLLDVSEITDALIQAGQASVKAAIGTGRSRIRVESGSLSLQLADASNVTVATDVQLGKISWGGAHAGFTGDEVVIGNGSAKLDVEVVMGHASIKAGTVPASADSSA